jgi:2-polyprenyl-6-hydroxyphenyl methylase/3-demethylubiquinone-9 3-methyltransferase
MSKINHDEDAAAARIENHDKPWFTECLTLLGQYSPTGLKVLDIGCGNGEAADLLKNMFQCQVSCLDYASAHLEKVKLKGYEAIHCNMDDESSLQKVAETYHQQFDAVICLQVIEHIFNPDAILQMAYAVLKPNGILIVATPNMAYIGYRIYSLFRGNIPPGTGHHISFFDSHRLWQQLFMSGFDPLQMVHYGAGEFYLDRAIGRSNTFWRKWMIRSLLYAGLWFGTKHLRHSGLICLSRKSTAASVGLSPLFRKNAFAKLTPDEKQCVTARVIPTIKAKMFEEHPELCQSFLKSP